MTTWRETTLGEVADLLVGHAYKSSDFSSDPKDVRLLRGVNIGQGFLDWGRPAFWPADKAIGSKYHLADGDVVLAMDRPWIEAGLKRARLRAEDLPSLLVQRVARLRGTDQVRTSFVHHLLATQRFSDYLQSIVTGATVPHISQTQIEAFRFFLPPIDDQERICELLDSLDDLVENNQRRIAAVDHMAHALYREWFVRFQFPGHEQVTFVDSVLGSIPEGWSPRVAGELERDGLLEIGDGYRAKNIEMVTSGSGLTFVRVANVGNGFFALRDADHLPSTYVDRLKSKVSRPGDSVISMKGTVGRSAVVAADDPLMAYSPQVSFWRSLDFKSLPPSYLYLWIRSEDFRTQCAAVKGATDMADYVNLTDQRRMRFMLPAKPVLAAFDSLAQPLLDTGSRLRRQADQAAALRDFLRPRLLTDRVALTHQQLGDVVGSVA